MLAAYYVEANKMRHLIVAGLLLASCGQAQGLEGRDTREAVSPAYETEADNTLVGVTIEAALSRTALILMDVWDTHANEGHALRVDDNVRSHIVPLLEAGRDSGLLIVHTPHLETTGKNQGYTHHHLVVPVNGEIVVDMVSDASRVLARILRARGIDTLLYAGYASNMCVMNNDTGINNMRALGFNIVLVRDASLSFEFPLYVGSVEDGAIHKAMVIYIESQYGASTTVKQVVDWLN